MNGYILLALTGAEPHDLWVNPELIAAMEVMNNGTELTMVGTPITFMVAEPPAKIFELIDALDAL